MGLEHNPKIRRYVFDMVIRLNMNFLVLKGIFKFFSISTAERKKNVSRREDEKRRIWALLHTAVRNFLPPLSHRYLVICSDLHYQMRI